MTGSGSTPSARLELRQLSGADQFTAAARLIAEVFGANDGPPLAVDTLAAIAGSGGFVGGAYLDGALVGTAVAFGEVAAPGGRDPVGLHSHVAAVAASARGLRIGQRLKWYQRDWACERGIEVIHWTFDPLVRRNATLNLNRLGGVSVRYDENLYGAIPDALNAGLESDRLLLRWDLTSDRVAAARQSDDLRTEPEDVITRIPTPPDVEALLQTDPPAARAWRQQVRKAFAELPPGWIATGIDAEGNYRVEQS